MVSCSEALPAHDAETLLVHFRRLEALKASAAHFRSINLNPQQLCDLEMLLTRAFYPLEGYLTRQDYETVLENMRLADGSFWPVPICLGVSEESAQGIVPGEKVAIRDGEGFALAILTVQDCWRPDLEREAHLLQNATGINAGHGESEIVWYLGGRVEGLSLPQRYDFTDLRLTPAETYRYLSQKGWRKTIAVQPGRALHRGDFLMLQDVARQEGASLLLAPVVVPSMYSSVEHFTLVRCLSAFCGEFSRNMARMCLTAWFHRNTGPRDLLLQAVMCRNYGCSGMLVWQDDAMQDGVALLTRYEAETGIRPVAEPPVVYNGNLDAFEVGVGTAFGCEIHRSIVSMLQNGTDVPAGISFPDVLSALASTIRPRSRQGFTLFFTGLSGAGKSTLAKVLYVKLLEMTSRPVTLLDGDIVRLNLSSELTFSKEHRELNVSRIGFVASEIVKNGGVAICAPIAPYPQSRRAARDMTEQYGGFIEIYVATPLTVCEQRDRKGLYAKARAGIVKGVTGIDDPYVQPENPELRIDTTELTPNEAAQEILLYLEANGYLG